MACESACTGGVSPWEERPASPGATSETEGNPTCERLVVLINVSASRAVRASVSSRTRASHARVASDQRWSVSAVPHGRISTAAILHFAGATTGDGGVSEGTTPMPCCGRDDTGSWLEVTLDASSSQGAITSNAGTFQTQCTLEDIMPNKPSSPVSALLVQIVADRSQPKDSQLHLSHFYFASGIATKTRPLKVLPRRK